MTTSSAYPSRARQVWDLPGASRKVDACMKPSLRLETSSTKQPSQAPVRPQAAPQHVCVGDSRSGTVRIGAHVSAVPC